MVGTMEAIKEYIRTHSGVTRAPLAYFIRKTIVIDSYGCYPQYAISADEIIAKMLPLPM